MTIYTDVSVDLETTGIRPDRAAIIQIAAVKFNLETGTVCHSFFDRALHPMPHRGWDEDTRLWWSKYPSVFNSIITRAEEPTQVLREFADWVGYNHEVPIRLWAKPSHYEHPFLESHFHDAGVHSCFHYRHVVDMQSYLFGRLGLKTLPDVQQAMYAIPFEGVPHNALHDALHQLKVILELREQG